MSARVWSALLTICGPLCAQAVVEVPLQAIPASRSTSLAVEIVDKTVQDPLARAFDLPRVVRRVLGRPYEALNVDAFDEVSNSSWFTHRNGRLPMAPEDVARGAGGSGPDTTRSWRVTAFKSAGVTPGMTIIDGRGDRYLIKFDPPQFQGLGSGAEVVASRLLHAAGYNVPQNHVTWLNPERLVLADEAILDKGPNDGRRPLQRSGLTQDVLADLVQQANPGNHNRVRVLASRFLPGRILGPFAYVGTRHDDANDVVPHEHRRELRGLYFVAAWINHADMKEENTLDVFDPQTRRVFHYLIDFGASLGSNSTAPSNPRRGRANSFDLGHSLLRLATLGFYVFDYERAPRTVTHPAVGYLNNDLFRPDGWKPMYPAPPFDHRTDRDAFWGTRLVTSFDDEQIRAAVTEARYPPTAAAAMVTFLQQRRDRIGRYWFTRVNPLDRFSVMDGVVRFEDLAVARGFARDAPGYQVEIRSAAGHTLGRAQVAGTSIALAPTLPADIELRIRPRRPQFSGQDVCVKLKNTTRGWTVVGIGR